MSVVANRSLTGVHSIHFPVNLLAVKPKWAAYAKVNVCHPSSNDARADNHAESPTFLDRLLLAAPFQVDDAVENFLITNSYVTVAGAWLGAFPIKLDWNEPWQAFPVTCMTGAIAANTIAHFVHVCYITVRSLCCR